MTEAFASLTGEPLLMRPWEIGRLTPYQVLRLINHPRDEHGAVVVGDRDGAGKTFQEQFFHARRLWNVPEWRIREQWREWQAEQEKVYGDSSGWGR